MRTIEIEVSADPSVLDAVFSPMVIESRSAPPGGKVTVTLDRPRSRIVLSMEAEELSVLRAMLNSYSGLMSAALRTAG